MQRRTTEGVSRRKGIGIPDKTDCTESTDTPALHQRGYGRNCPVKAVSADVR